MLKTRVYTALVLFAVMLAVLYSKSFLAFAILTIAFFAAAIWENFRLFAVRQPMIGAAIWTAGFAAIIFNWDTASINAPILFGLCIVIWLVRLAPSLAIGLPPQSGSRNRLLNYVYSLAILGCFVAIVVLFKHSPLYLLSVMAMVWIADIGAYFVGKAIGKRKLAPTISPGKSWEGAIGGVCAVLLAGAASTLVPTLSDTFAVKLQLRWGWPVFMAGILVLVAISVVGDLFESQLKRRAGVKDSSNLLPGHGGVLDRVDALIPALPLAAFFHFYL